MNTRPLLAALLAAAAVGQAQANIDIQFDYSRDTAGFFTPERQAVLDSAANAFEWFGDSLAAIHSSATSGNRFDVVFFDPTSPNSDVTLNNFSVGANAIKVFVGSYAFTGSTLGAGGPGGYGCSGYGSYCDDAATRGQGEVNGPAANDVALWGGSIAFDADTNWYSGLTTAGLKANQFDLYSVVVHELAHVLGFGTSDAFRSKITGSSFVGASSGVAALSGDQGHWAEGTVSTFNGSAQEAAMDPSINAGTRKYFSVLEYAAMRDIGWQTSTVPEPQAWALLLGGMGVVCMSLRRRRQTQPAWQGHGTGILIGSELLKGQTGRVRLNAQGNRHHEGFNTDLGSHALRGGTSPRQHRHPV